MSIHGVNGEDEVIYMMNQYSLKDPGVALKMNQNIEVGIQPVCHHVL